MRKTLLLTILVSIMSFSFKNSNIDFLEQNKEYGLLEYSLVYSAYKNDLNIQSVLYSTYSYYDGAAHGMENIYSINVKNNTEYINAEIYKDKKEILKYINSHKKELFCTKSYKYSKKNKEIVECIGQNDIDYYNINDDITENILNSTATLFSTENINNKKMRYVNILFKPYEIAPYSSGVIEIKIPYNDISKYIK